MLKKTDIIARMSQKGYTKRDAEVIIDDFVNVIMEAMAGGEDVQLHGFGTFYVRDMRPRDTVDYQTKGRIVIPAHKAPKFIPGGTLRRVVKEGIMRA